MSKVNHLFIKGFGFGVFSAEIVPPNPEVPEDQSDLLFDLTKEFLDRINESGIGMIKETVLDPNTQERAFLVLEAGSPPCQMEIDQLDEYSSRIEMAIRFNPDSLLAKRYQMIKEASNNLKNT